MQQSTDIAADRHPYGNRARPIARKPYGVFAALRRNNIISRGGDEARIRDFTRHRFVTPFFALPLVVAQSCTSPPPYSGFDVSRSPEMLPPSFHGVTVALPKTT